jgi:hypothetical protein
MLQFHVAISVVGILSGLIVLYGLLAGEPYPLWTAIFLITTILTSVTGFPLEPYRFDPPRVVGVISLILLAFAVIGYYGFGLDGNWLLDLCRLRGRRGLSECFRRRRAGVHEAALAQSAGADAKRADVPRRPGLGAPDFRRAWRVGGDQVSPRDRRRHVKAEAIVVTRSAGLSRLRLSRLGRWKRLRGIARTTPSFSHQTRRFARSTGRAPPATIEG